MRLVEFVPNAPQELALGSETSPVKLPSGAGCLYTLSDGRMLHLPEQYAPAMASLELQPGETFRVIFHKRDQGYGYWSIWMTPETEKRRAEAEIPEVERQLSESLHLVNKGGRPALAAAQAELRPTGTDPAPIPKCKPAVAATSIATRGKPGPIPMNVAFREIVRFVQTELNASGEQWSDESRQDLVSTVFIAAQKANLLSVWERNAA